MIKKIKKYFIIISSIIVLGVVIISILKFIDNRNTTKVENLIITSEAFKNGGTIPIQYTGRGEDISPELKLSQLSEEAKTIAIIMDDIDYPFKIFTHWVIWNIPAQNIIPEKIPYGDVVESLGNAIQGISYGKHKYRGPKPPFGSHRYKFNVYVLDCELNLNSTSGKKELLKSMEGHIIQYGSIIGRFK